MRRILAVMITVILMAVPVCADEYGDMWNDVYGETDISCHVYSTYYVTIPTELTSDNPNGEVTVTMDHIEDGYHIDLYATNLAPGSSIDLQSEKGNVINVGVRKNGNYYIDDTGLIATFYPEYYTADGDMAYGLISLGDIPLNAKPGVYSGKLYFRVSCVEDGAEDSVEEG